MDREVERQTGAISLYRSPTGIVSVWDPAAVLCLRTEHRIVGTLVGHLPPQLPQQPGCFSLPLILMPEEVTLLLEKGRPLSAGEVSRGTDTWKDWQSYMRKNRSINGQRWKNLHNMSALTKTTSMHTLLLKGKSLDSFGNRRWRIPKRTLFSIRNHLILRYSRPHHLYIIHGMDRHPPNLLPRLGHGLLLRGRLCNLTSSTSSGQKGFTYLEGANLVATTFSIQGIRVGITPIMSPQLPFHCRDFRPLTRFPWAVLARQSRRHTLFAHGVRKRGSLLYVSTGLVGVRKKDHCIFHSFELFILSIFYIHLLTCAQ